FGPGRTRRATQLQGLGNRERAIKPPSGRWWLYPSAQPALPGEDPLWPPHGERQSYLTRWSIRRRAWRDALLLPCPRLLQSFHPEGYPKPPALYPPRRLGAQAVEGRFVPGVVSLQDPVPKPSWQMSSGR